MTDLVWHVDPDAVSSTLHRPVLVAAFTGWFDLAGAATAAVHRLEAASPRSPVASIDPEGFFDFSRRRPTVALDQDDRRVITWPGNEVVAHPLGRDRVHDLLLLGGEEPYLRWATFAELVVGVAERCGCEMVVTLGAAADAVPHTREPRVVGSSANDELARRLGLSRPRYQGPTGVVGVLQVALERRGLPAISLRVGVPHYLASTPHPMATLTLLRHLGHVLGVPITVGDLPAEAAEWRERHDTAVAGDAEAADHVRRLEADFDRRLEASLPSGDELAAELERYLREQRGEG